MADAEVRPRARSEDLLTQQLDDELLIYDRVSHEAHSLDPTAAALWQACDGRSRLDDLASAVGLSRDGVEEALVVLSERGLLAAPLDPSGVSRRAVLRRGLIAGGAIGVGAPVIRSALVPSPAQAAVSCLPDFQPCSTNSQCCSGNCFAGTVCQPPPVSDARLKRNIEALRARTV